MDRPFQPRGYSSRNFYTGLAVLLVLVGIYTWAVLAWWSETPLGLEPQGEARAWLAVAQSMHDGTAPHEPFFRAPAYPTLLALMLDAGLPSEDLANAARAINGLAHLVATAIIVLAARRLWRRTSGAMLAGALWGFYPPAVFLAAEPRPITLALLVWLIGAAVALGILWLAPAWQGGRRTHRHFWAYPLVAGMAFALAAVLNAPWWPAALLWPLVTLFLGSDGRGVRLLASAAGVGAVLGGVLWLQDLWGGSAQPLAGADLYRLTMAAEVTEPWAVALPAVDLREDLAGPDVLEDEARIAYAAETGAESPGRAVMAGYWWRRAAVAAGMWPLRTGLRTMRKAYQFFHYEQNSTGASLARAGEDTPWLAANPLSWPLLFAAGGVGLILARRQEEAWLAVGLAGLAGAGALLWYPTMEARAPVAAVLAILSSGLTGRAWPRGAAKRLVLILIGLGLAGLAVLPRPRDPAALLYAQDARQRALSWAALGDYDNALAELVQLDKSTDTSAAGRELVAGWRFARVLKFLPKLPPKSELEADLLNNAEMTMTSPGAQFRSGAYLWLLGQHEGAIFYWRGMAGLDGKWSAAARAAIAASGEETPDEALQRQAWELGGGPAQNPALKPFFFYMEKSPGNPAE